MVDWKSNAWTLKMDRRHILLQEKVNLLRQLDPIKDLVESLFLVGESFKGFLSPLKIR